MRDSDIQRLESTFGIALPETYRRTLADLTGPPDEFPEVSNDADQLIEMNVHFTMVPDDLSELRGENFLDHVRFFLFYKSPKKLVEQRFRHKREWAGNSRFLIGTDLGEEHYFINLKSSEPKVYCFELETGAISEAAPNLSAWREKARVAADSE